MNFKTSLIAGITFAVLATTSVASANSVATGKSDGYYNNGLFNQFNAAVKRVSGGELELDRYNDKGTDGTKANIKLVSSGKANIAFVQLGGTVLDPNDNVEIIGTVMYELAHLVVPVKGKVGDCDDLENKKGYSTGYNMFSGSAVTIEVMQKEDKDYKNLSAVDVDKSSRAIAAMTKGDLDAYFFVSAPKTKSIQRINNSEGVKFANCWDGDFDDFKVNGKRLYTKVKVGKAEGYAQKFTTFRVPAVVIANKEWLEENEDYFDYLFDATTMTFNNIKGTKKLKYYPKK